MTSTIGGETGLLPQVGFPYLPYMDLVEKLKPILRSDAKLVLKPIFLYINGHFFIDSIRQFGIGKTPYICIKRITVNLEIWIDQYQLKDLTRDKPSTIRWCELDTLTSSAPMFSEGPRLNHSGALVIGDDDPLR